MRIRASLVENKKSVESFLLVCVIVAASLAVMLPLTAPKVEGQVIHLGNTSSEDGTLPYDITTAGDWLVYWDIAEDHILTGNYMVEPGWELRIPPLDDVNPNPPDNHDITVQDGVNITVMPGGKLTFETDGDIAPTRTKFVFSGFGSWDGIFFEADSEGVIQDVEINGAKTCITLSPGAKVANPGIKLSRFQDYSEYGIYSDGAVGNTNIHTSVDFLDPAPQGTGVYVSNGHFNLTDITISGHGPDLPNVHIRNATVTASNNYYNGADMPGNSILVENSPAPNSTVQTGCFYQNGVADNYYVRCDGASPLIVNGTFDEANNALAVLANEDGTGKASHVTLLNPNAPAPFNSTRINATDSSTVTLNWYVNVYVDDPDGNPIPNSLVDLEDPSWPDTKLTASGPPIEEGWAKWFVVTDKVIRNDTTDNFNPLNASAENNTMMGYAIPEPPITGMTDVFITVPFNPIANTPPSISYIETPGEQTGLIYIDFVIDDPDAGQDGDLSVMVFFSYDGGPEIPCTAHATSDPTTGLSSGVTYTFVWDSRDPKDMQNIFSTNVYVKIIPYDPLGPGTPDQTGIFTVDNAWPVVLTGPTPNPTDNDCDIVWTLDEPATAEVWYGLWVTNTTADLTDEVSDPTLSTSKSLNLPNLWPGRRYIYVINSTDNQGNKYTSGTYTFETTFNIQLYTGWNMISIPMVLADIDLGDVLSSITGDWDIAMWYDAHDPVDQWKVNHTGKPDYMNDLHIYFPEGMALWLHVITNTVLSPSYSFDNEYVSGPLALAAGWNFIGYNSVTPRSVDDALSSIAGWWDKVEHYDAETDTWLVNDGPGGQPDTLTTMEPKKGYWIYLRGAVDLDLSYT